VKETDRPVGYVRINWMDGDQEGAWLRFAMGEERGKGFMKDALRAYLGHLFEGGAHRVDAEVYESNEVSLGLLESLGFVVEGRKREACRAGGRRLDMHVLGLLERDFAGA
jgi:RimJ/RimL family protein N-acetyltransferase